MVMIIGDILANLLSPKHLTKNLRSRKEIESRIIKITKRKNIPIAHSVMKLILLENKLTNPAYISITGTNGAKINPKASTHFAHNALAINAIMPIIP
jgi:hypothetical protein